MVKVTQLECDYYCPQGLVQDWQGNNYNVPIFPGQQLWGVMRFLWQSDVTWWYTVGFYLKMPNGFKLYTYAQGELAPSPGGWSLAWNIDTHQATGGSGPGTVTNVYPAIFDPMGLGGGVKISTVKEICSEWIHLWEAPSLLATDSDADVYMAGIRVLFDIARPESSWY